ncbi:MAG: response regulator [Treponema sp.]|jgi:PAS domain S-box-containing protein|nr:response regulator [Treponema sp.]
MKKDNLQSNSKELMAELERLVDAAITGDFGVTLDTGNLSPSNKELVNLINSVIRNYKSSTEYETMKYKLTSDALSIALWDMDVVNTDPVNPNNKFTWSQEFRNMLGFTGENDFPNVLHSWSSRLHPDDKERTLAAFNAHINDKTGKTPYYLEYRLMRKDGQYRNYRAFGASLRDSNGTPIRVAGALQDIEEERQISQTLKYREQLLNALHDIDIMLFSHKHESFDQVLSESLKPIADTAKLDRVIFYYLLEVGEGKEKHFGQVYRWDREEGGLIHLDDELTIVPNIPAIKNWIDVLSKGQIINIKSSTMTTDEKVFLNAFNIKSILLTPFLVNDELWGAVAFQDHTDERDFDEDCIGFLNSAARLCNNAIIKNEKTQSAKNSMEALKRREKMMRTLNNAAIKFLSQSENSFDETMTAGVRLIVDTLEVDRLSLWRNFSTSRGLHASQIYRWDRESGGTTIPTMGLEDVTYADLAPRWEELFASDESINSPVHLLPEAAMLQSFGVVSVFITPIFIGNEFWGFALFEDRHKERYFNDECVEMMRSAAFLCTNTVIMNDKTQTAIKALEAVTRREKMMSALNETAMTLLEDNTKKFDDVMSSSLKPVAAAAGIDRVAVYRLLDGKDQLGQIYLWYGKTLPLEDELVVLPDIPPIKRWLKKLIKGDCININLKDAEDDEVDFLNQFGVRSAFMVPIFTRGHFWGVITLEDHTNYRYFIEESLDLLRSAAHLCAGAIVRAEMEHQIRAANEFTRATLDAAPIGYAIFDTDLKLIECNDTIVELLKTTKKTYTNNFFDFSPEFQPNGVKSSEKALEYIERGFEGEKMIFEWTHRATTGELIPFEITLLCTTYNDKCILQAYQYDLRNIKTLEKNIHDQRELLKIRLEQQELISEISRGFISSGDSESYIKEAIARLGRYNDVSSVVIFNIAHEQMKAFSTYYWSADDTPPQITEVDLHACAISSFPERLPECLTMPVLTCEDVSASKGELYYALTSNDVQAFICVPLYVDGRLWGVLNVEQNFTARKWTENEKSFVALTARTIAGVIMRNIYNTMLQDALQRATSASKAKGEFLSNMSHEMRTPLNAIIGMTAIAKNATDIERKNYALNKIDDASSHLLGVINDVLDMSKIEANKLELSSVEFFFEKVLQKIVTVLTFRLEEKHQKLTVNIDKDIPEYIIGDDQRLTQVITNLLWNAVKFTPEYGSIDLAAKFIKEEDGICTIQVSVSDTGIGVSPEQQIRLFKSFQQAEASTVRKYGGTGLGLAISKSIVEMMGGRIWVESTLGEGSVFSFTIKVKRGEGKPVSLRERAINWDEIRILAVDDDPDILALFKDIAARYGLYCDTAISGDDAIRLVNKNGSYNIYFIDWKMPGIDGVTLTGALKTIERKESDSIVIMISAAQWTEIEKEARKAGVERFISKPLFPSAIVDTIGECLGVDKYAKDKDNAQAKNNFAGHHVLLVEDVEINREIVLTILEPTELEIDCAENGVEAVEMFKANPDKYEMILMDVQMPEMDGYSATRLIRMYEKEQRRGKPISIIAMTANVFKEDIEKCLNAGMDDHIGKPLDFELVMEKLNKYLR